FKVAEFEILFGQGISRMGCILDLATELKFIVKSGSWYSYNEEKIGQGRDRAIEYLKKNPDIADDLELKIKAAKLA
ncbi:MAG TPA: DNA recombination/repair protein RecA, partial [Eubacteriales bacterium]|nr:DNA recombination/repair protein RecA [Eubacteriales bacterium]